MNPRRGLLAIAKLSAEAKAHRECHEWEQATAPAKHDRISGDDAADAKFTASPAPGDGLLLAAAGGLEE